VFVVSSFIVCWQKEYNTKFTHNNAVQFFVVVVSQLLLAGMKEEGA
jgi:hypothetical protein